MSKALSATKEAERRAASTQAVAEESQKLERFQINHRRVVFLEQKAPPEGSFGDVLRAELHHSAYLPASLGSRWYGPPQVVAVKQIKGLTLHNTQKVERFTREMLVWCSLEAHPGIAKFLGFYVDFKHSEAWLLSPWEPNGNVREFIEANKLEVPERLSLVYDTVDALAFLHQLNPPVCHGDIKSANVLVGADYKARLCDLGLALLHEDSGLKRLGASTSSKGSARWNSPEIIGGAPRAPTSDVYAWALLAWEIMAGDLPCEETTSDYATIRKIFESPLPQVDGESRLSQCLQLWNLMTRCWNPDPQKRPTSGVCKTTVAYLPRCTPTLANPDNQTRSAAQLENLGDLESWKGNVEKSSTYLGNALQLYQQQEDTMSIARVFRKQAAAACRDSDFVVAIAKATTALEHFRNLKYPLGIADASLTLGDSLILRNQEDDALPVLLESLKIYRTHGNDVGTARCFERIADIQRGFISKDEPVSALEDAVAAAYRSGDHLAVARAFRTMGDLLFERGYYKEAAEAFSKGLPIAQKIGWNTGSANMGQQMGLIKMEAGDYHEAEALLQDSISVARQSREQLVLAWTLTHLGKCFQKQSKLDEAASVLKEACLVFEESSRLADSLAAALALVEVNTRQGDWDGVLSWHDHIIAAYRSQGRHWNVATQLEQKAKLFLNLQRHDEAALHFEAALVTHIEHRYFWSGGQGPLSAIPKTAMKWERKFPRWCDLRKLRRLQPLRTAILGFQISFVWGEI